MKPRILVIDDHIEIAESLQALLEFEGFSCHVAFNGVQGLKIATETTFDCIVTDLSMPELDGLSLCKKLRANPSTGRIPILVQTGNHEPPPGMGRLFDDLVKKPCEFPDLLERIQDLMRAANAPSGGEGG
jgi:CheY-like chemotaxis protein